MQHVTADPARTAAGRNSFDASPSELQLRQQTASAARRRSDTEKPRPGRRKHYGKLTAILAVLLLVTGAVVRDSAPEEIRLWTVEPALFRDVVETRGTVEPLRTTRVASECRWSTRILSVVPEGTWVQKGDVVCVLDNSEITEFLRSREVQLIRARAGLESSVQDELIEQTRSERLMSQAEFNVQDSELELLEFAEAVGPQQMEELDRRLRVAESRSDTIADDYEFTHRMWLRGQAGFRAMEQASFDLLSQQTSVEALSGRRHVLAEFEHPRTQLQLEFRQENAERELLRTQIATSLAETRARLSTLSDERRVAIYERYVESARKSLEACTLRAPRDGQIVHANSWYSKSRGETAIEPGRSVTFQQPIFEIPDGDHFKISVPVDEALITRLYQGMPAVVQLTGYEQTPISGKVTHISRYPRPRSYFTPGVQDYWLDVVLYPTADQFPLIRNKMDAVATLTLREIPDALMIPRRAMIGEAGRFFVWRMQNEDLVAQPVIPGDVQGDHVVIREGLQQGDRIAMDLSPQHKEALERHLRGTATPH